MKKYLLLTIFVIIFTLSFALTAAAEDLSIKSETAVEEEETASALAPNLSDIEFDGESYLVENYDYFRLKAIQTERPTVGLALSGGGARAIANLGVIKALVEHDIPIDMMTGTSMGSIIASLYGSGLSLEQLEAVVTDTPFANLFNFGGGALLNSRKVNIFMEEISPQKNLEDFLIPTAQLSFDLREGKKYLATEGQISDVLQAAYSIPGYFPIHTQEEHYFIDAGILESSPAKSASLLGADFVIATHTPEGVQGEDYNYSGAFQSAGRFIELMQQQYSGQILERYADFVITVDVERFTFMDFNYANRLVEIGYNETIARMDELKAELEAANIPFVESEERELYYLDSVLRDLEFDRLIVEESGISPLVYYGQDSSPFTQSLFRTNLNQFQLGAEIYYNQLRLAFLGDDSWSEGYSASFRFKKLTDSLDLNLKYANDYDSATEDDYEAEIKFFGNRFNISAGFGRRQNHEYYLFGNDFRYLGEKLEWKTENDIFFGRDLDNLDLLTSHLISYDFTDAWGIKTKIIYNSSDFAESPVIYRGQELNSDIPFQSSLNFHYNYNLNLPLQFLKFLQLTDVGGSIFIDYYNDGEWLEGGIAVGPALNSRIYILGLKPIEVDIFAAHDFEKQEQRYGLQFSYSF